jgi:hypothetical protein
MRVLEAAHRAVVHPSRPTIIDYIRLRTIPADTLRYSILPHSTPLHSHSIVPGGLLVTSYTTRLTPFTSLMIRVAVSPRNFMSKE